MLTRSFTRYLNSVYSAPDDEGGADVGADDNISDTGGDGAADTDAGDGGGEPSEPAEGQKPLSVRDEIKKAMAEASGDKPPVEKPAKKAASKKAAATAAAPAGNQPTAPAAPETAAPARLSTEAKADWSKTPPSIQQAFIKAEQDMANGVEQLKQRYATIDQALAPHQDALRQMNATPGEAVNRMFLWFKALAANPREAFPALAKSMNQDWAGITTPQQQQAAQQQPGQQQPGQPQPAAVPDEVRSYVSNLERSLQQLQQQLGAMQTGYSTIQNDIQAQNMQKTEENLNLWSKDKDHFAEVRQDMARLIQADPATLIKNGQVDLDAAYERAIYYNPVVRAKVLAAQQQANQQVQQQTTEAATTARQGQVAKARKAAVSLPVSSPGDRLAPVGKKPNGKMSVRDSLRASIAQLREDM